MFDLFLKMESNFKYDTFKNLGLAENGFILITLHRDYNVDDRERLLSILTGLQRVKNSNNKIVFPIHPRTQKMVKNFGFEEYLKGIIVTEPIDYLNLMGLVKMSTKVITDSGGLQKEAYFAQKRCGVLLIDTGWQELIDNGWNRLLEPKDIEDFILNSDNISFIPNIYGEGDAGEKIVKEIAR